MSEEPEGELTLARIALHERDFAHAAVHMSNAITEDPSLPAVYQSLRDLDVASGGALELFPSDRDVFIGTVAARSYLCAAGGHFDDALALLSMVARHEPHKPWAACGWLDADGVAERAGDRIVPGTHGQWLARHTRSAELWLRPDDGHISILSSAADALDWLVEHADSG